MKVSTLSLILILGLLLSFAFHNNASAAYVRDERTPTTWSGAWTDPGNVVARDELTNERVPSAWTGTWVNPGNVVVLDNVNASSSTNGAQEVFYNFNFGNLGSMVKVDSVLVGLNWVTIQDENATIALSNNGGASYSATSYLRIVPTLKQHQWIDVSSAYGWTPAMLSDASFRVRITYVQVGGVASEIRIDLLTVRVVAGAYASSSTNGASEVYGDFGFAPPTTLMRLGVYVGLEMYAAEDESVRVEVSNNGGASYSASSYISLANTTEYFRLVDVSSAYSWTPAMLSDANFKVRITYVQVGGTGGIIRVDLLSVKIVPAIVVMISPTVVPGKVGRNIQFDIYINEITEDVLDLGAWELKLNWTDTDFNYVGAAQGPFLGQSGSTLWVTPSRVTSLGQEVLTLSCIRTGGGSGSLGSGVLATVTLYVVGGTTGSVFDLWSLKLRNSVLTPIEPPTVPPQFDIKVYVQDGTFALPRSYDLEPTFGEVDIYDLSTVSVNFGTNVIRVTKIPTQWAVGTWTTPGFVGSSDNNHAFATAQNAQQAWTNFGFNTTSWTAVSKVELGLERRASLARSIQINMSNNNGASWSNIGYTHPIAETYDTMVWIDVSTAYSWTKADVNSIAVRLTVLGTGTIPVYVDYLAIRVTPSPVKVPPEAFNPEADVNNDLQVDIDDLVMVAINYGTYEL